MAPDSWTTMAFLTMTNRKIGINAFGAQCFIDSFVLVIVSNGYKFIVLLQCIEERKKTEKKPDIL